MRDWEEDFDFDFDNSIGLEVNGKKDIRIDTYPTIQADKTKHSDNDERRTRIVAHKERVQREMQVLGISEGRFI